MNSLYYPLRGRVRGGGAARKSYDITPRSSRHNCFLPISLAELEAARKVSNSTLQAHSSLIGSRGRFEDGWNIPCVHWL